MVHRGGNYGRYLTNGFLVYVNEGTLFAAPFDLAERKFTRTPAPVIQGVPPPPARSTSLGRGHAGLRRG